MKQAQVNVGRDLGALLERQEHTGFAVRDTEGGVITVHMALIRVRCPKLYKEIRATSEEERLRLKLKANGGLTVDLAQFLTWCREGDERCLLAGRQVVHGVDLNRVALATLIEAGAPSVRTALLILD